MIDTLVVAIVLCVDTCSWNWKQKFEYADVMYDIEQVVKIGVNHIQQHGKKSFYWHLKNVFYKKDDE